MLETANGQRLEALYAVLLLCGLRLGEALALSWDEIDFAERRLTVRRSLARIGRNDEGGSKLVLQEPKTARARRVLHLPDRVSTVLRTHRARQASERLVAGADWHDCRLVFCNGIWRPLEASAVTRNFKRVLQSTGLPSSTRIHDLRHSSASLLLSLGVPLKTIQEILGHGSIRVTADIYAHVAPQMLRDAADRMDAIFLQCSNAETVAQEKPVAVNSGCQISLVATTNDGKAASSI